LARLNNDTEVDNSLHKSISKKNDNPELLPISFDRMNRYHTYTLYADGSKAENLIASADTLPTLELKKQTRLCNKLVFNKK